MGRESRNTVCLYMFRDPGEGKCEIEVADDDVPCTREEENRGRGLRKSNDVECYLTASS